MRLFAIVALALSIGLRVVQAQTLPAVPGRSVSVYAQVIHLAEMAFDPGRVLFAGTDVPSTPAPPVALRRVAPDGTPPTAFGPALEDPDGIVVDIPGRFGSAGSLLVGNWTAAQAGGIWVVHMNGSAAPLVTGLWNPNSLAWDSGGRLIFGDDDYVHHLGLVYAWTPGAPAPSLLFTVSGRMSTGAVAVDAQDRIYTLTEDGVIRLHDAAGLLVDPSVQSGVGWSSAIAVGPGTPAWGSDLYTVREATGELLRIGGAGGAQVVGTGFTHGVSSLVFGPGGALFVAERTADRILRIGSGPAAATASGAGCPGTGGQVPVLAASAPPTLGLPSFTIDVTGAPPFSDLRLFGALGLGQPPVPIGGGCLVHLELTSLIAFLQAGLSPIGPLPAGPAGTLSFPFPIPFDPAFGGVHLALQATAVDAGAPLGFTVTNGLLLELN